MEGTIKEAATAAPIDDPDSVGLDVSAESRWSKFPCYRESMYKKLVNNIDASFTWSWHLISQLYLNHQHEQEQIRRQNVFIKFSAMFAF